LDNIVNSQIRGIDASCLCCGQQWRHSARAILGITCGHRLHDVLQRHGLTGLLQVVEASLCTRF
jgi:hypothetical protein